MTRRSTVEPEVLSVEVLDLVDPREGGQRRAEERAELVATDAQRRAEEFIREQIPEGTRKARLKARRYWVAWLRLAHGLEEHYPVAPALLLDFIESHLNGLPEAVDTALQAEGRKRPGTHTLATIEARVSHLSKAHQATGCESPATDPRCRELLAAARRQRARKGGQLQKKALTLDLLEKLLRTCEVDIEVGDARDRLAAYRDRALLLVTWAAGGRRRSEAVSLCVEDLRNDAGEYVWTLGHSKTNQDGSGQETYPIAGRAAEALTAWLQIAGISAGAVFRAIDRHGHLASRAMVPRSLAEIVKYRAGRAGLDPADYSGHSLRSGFVTSAGRAGVSLQEVMQLSGHRTPAVAMRYHQAGDVLRSRAARLAG